MNNILAIDTSTETGLVILSKQGQLFERVQKEPREHNRHLLPMIEAVCKEAKLSLQEIDALVCGVGPGSFVGVRLGVSVMQGLAYALQKPVYALSSLALQAQAFFRSHPHASSVWVVQDARMQAVYVGHYHKQEGVAQAKDHEQLLQIAPLKAVHIQNEAITGNAAAVLRSGIENEFIVEGTPELQGEDLQAQSLYVIDQRQALQPHDLQPIYLQDESHWKKINPAL